VAEKMAHRVVSACTCICICICICSCICICWNSQFVFWP